MERRGSAIFYLEEEEDEEVEEEAEEAMEQEDNDSDMRQTTAAEDSEKYTVVAVRAKLSVEVEQRKRLGTWAKRVLVLDGSTLYAYKTKGEGGSVGGWTVGGADVRVGRGSDSSRDDGRHLLVISRPPAYKLTFSFNTTYEQARMIQALSSSGATVTGLDAIMLLKNLKKQQEEEQEEEEERQRGLKEQRRAFEESRQRSDTMTSVGSVVEERKGDVDCEDDDLSIEYEKNKEEEEVEINRSIYDAGTGVVNNPLYSSQINLSSCDDGGEDARDKIHSSYTYSGTSGASDTSAPASDASVGNQDAVGKVNPVPKPPRTTYGDRRPSTESQSFQSDDETKNFTEVSDSLRQQSYSGSRKDERVSDTAGLEEGPADVPSVQDDEGSRFDACDFGEEVEDDEGEIVEARNRLYSNPEDSEEGEGFYQVNSDSDEDTHRVGSESSLRKLGKTTGEGELGDVDFLRGDQCSDSSLTEEEKEEEVQKESFEGNYSDLLNKMKLERALSIDSEASGHSPGFGSPAASRKRILNSPIDTALSVSPTALDDGEIGSDREENGRYGSEREHGDIQSSDEDQKMMQCALTEALSDSEEKFEQLYNRLRKDSIEYLETEDYGENERSEQTTNEKNVTSVLEGEVKKSSASSEDIVKENGHIAGEDMLDSPSGSPSEMTTKKRVNSIIKKKDKGMPTSGTGTIKKVQFNLEVDTIESPATSESDLLVTAKDLAKKNEDSTVASAKEKLESLTDKKTKEVSCKSAGGHDLREEATVTARTSPTAEKKTIDSTAESQTKKETSGTKSPPSPSKKKSRDSSVTSPSKKKVTEPSNSHTPTKKKGIFSSIFSSSSTKKSDTSSAKDDTSSKKKSSDSPTQAVRQQQTVDLSAPSIISGQVEIGGSVGGRLNTRLLEVRDGQALAYLPRASSTPSSRISLLGLSVTPVLGGVHAHALALTRAARCMMVIKLGSREEQMLWINTLSDEVIKITPDDQRSGLTLYPTPKKDEEKKLQEEDKKERWEDKQQESKDSEREQREKKHTNNTYAEDAGKSVKEVSLGKEISTSMSQEVPVVNGEPLHSSDDKGKTGLQESDDHVFSPQRSASVDDLNEINERRKLENSGPRYHGRTVSENGGESKIGTYIDKKIRQLSLEQLEPEYPPGKADSQTCKKNFESKSNHPPLRRLSGLGRVTSPSTDPATDTVDNFLMVCNIPGSSSNRQTNHSQPMEKLNKFSRIISSSESSLQTPVAPQGSAGPRPVQRCDSEILSHANSRDHPTRAGNRITRDKTLTRGSGCRGSQTSTSDSDQQLNEARASPAYSSSPSLSFYSLSEPRKIEIIENSSTILGPRDGQERCYSADSDRWFGDNDSSGTEAPTPVKDDTEVIPRITWSVAATREKFELLCSVSGESKGGRLTTKTPISRKRSGRGTVKKKRSLEGAVSRRSTVRRGVRRSLEEDLISSSQELKVDASYSNMDLQTQRKTRLEPARDLRRNFEKDRTSSSSPASHCSSPQGAESQALATDTNDALMPRKTSLRRTSNVLQEPYSPASSPEPRILTSRSLNTRPQGGCVVGDRGRVTRSSSSDSSRPSSAQDNDVVVCWRGPYIAQDSSSEPTWDEGGAESPKEPPTEKEAEQAVLSNISNAFLAKRRLLTREVAAAKIQERLSLLEERLWSLQASMADIDVSGVISVRETRQWKSLEKSVRAVEEETMYWNTRLTQTQKEAEQARQKLAAALASGLAQLSPGTPDNHRPQDREPDVSEA